VLAASVGRLWGARATEEDPLRVWRHRELPWKVRRAVFTDVLPGDRLVSEWRREHFHARGFGDVHRDRTAADDAEIASLFEAYSPEGLATLERASLEIPESRESALALRALLSLDRDARLRVGKSRTSQPSGPKCRTSKTCGALAAAGIDVRLIVRSIMPSGSEEGRDESAVARSRRCRRFAAFVGEPAILGSAFLDGACRGSGEMVGGKPPGRH
jgi:hypothetical protein